MLLNTCTWIRPGICTHKATSENELTGTVPLGVAISSGRSAQAFYNPRMFAAAVVFNSLSYPAVARGTNNKLHTSCLLGSSGVGQKILTVLLADGAAISKQMATGVFPRLVAPISDGLDSVRLRFITECFGDQWRLIIWQRSMNPLTRHRHPCSTLSVRSKSGLFTFAYFSYESKILLADTHMRFFWCLRENLRRFLSSRNLSEAKHWTLQG